jgi:phosphohistidine phosphatase
LLLLRHAKSSWAEPEQPDVERPLNDRGRAAAKLMGKKMRHEDVSVDILLASTATRVRETLDLLLPAWHWDGPIVWEKELYLASRETILELVAALADEWQSVLVVGHNPGLSDLVGFLTEEATDMPTAALAILSSDQGDWPTALRHRPWQQLAFWKPKDLE